MVATESQLIGLRIGWELSKLNVKERVRLECGHCGKPFFKLECQIVAKLPMCSRECYWKHKKGKKPIHFLDKDGKFRKDIAEKISKSLSGKPQPLSQNEKHHEWKGDNASYTAFHQWIRRKYGKAYLCENSECSYPRLNSQGKLMLRPKMYHWALIHGCEHGHYRERYMMMCVSCHLKYDHAKD